MVGRRERKEIQALADELREMRLANERQQELDRVRHEELSKELSREYREQLQITREVVRRNELAFNGVQAVQAELVAEVRALREGVLVLIDELRGSGPSPATS